MCADKISVYEIYDICILNTKVLLSLILCTKTQDKSVPKTHDLTDLMKDKGTVHPGTQHIPLILHIIKNRIRGSNPIFDIINYIMLST